MKHAAFPSLTFSALAKSAAEIRVLDSMADFIPEDYREITAFLDHEQIGWGDSWKTIGKDLIAVALADLDDPTAAIEILNRDEAYHLFGRQWVEDLERVE